MSVINSLKYPLNRNYRRYKQLTSLIRYIEDMGIKIKSISNRNSQEKGISGSYTEAANGDPPSIEVLAGRTGLETIYILLHEMGHHMHYLDGITPREDKAYSKYPDGPNDPLPAKCWRNIIVAVEKKACRNAIKLEKQLELGIPRVSFYTDTIYAIIGTEYALTYGLSVPKLKRKMLWKKASRLFKEYVAYFNL